MRRWVAAIARVGRVRKEYNPGAEDYKSVLKDLLEFTVVLKAAIWPEYN